MSLAPRIFTLALLLGWQAVASGMGLEHSCPKQASTGTSCKCPHEVKEARNASPDEPSVRKDCCEAPDRDLPAPALVEASGHAFVLPPASPPRWLALKAPEESGRLSLALWDSPHAQGPPVFLRIRSLLI